MNLYRRHLRKEKEAASGETCPLGTNNDETSNVVESYPTKLGSSTVVGDSAKPCLPVKPSGDGVCMKAERQYVGSYMLADSVYSKYMPFLFSQKAVCALHALRMVRNRSAFSQAPFNGNDFALVFWPPERSELASVL